MIQFRSPFSESQQRYILPLATLLLALMLWQGISFLWERNKVAEVWKLIPGDAVALVTVDSVATVWQQTDSLVLWQHLQGIGFFAQMTERVKQISHADLSGSLSWLEAKQLHISLHITARDDFDFVFYLPLASGDEQILAQIIQSLTMQGLYNIEKRNYQGLHITEVTNVRTRQMFSMVQYKNYWIGSFTPVLVEDVIRNLASSGHDNFYRRNKSAFTDASQRNTPVKIYIANQKLAEWLASFTSDGAESILVNAGGLFETLNLTTEASQQTLSLTGSASQSDKSAFVHIFKQQEAPDFTELLPLLPVSAARIVRLGFNDGKKLWKDINEYWKNHRPAALGAARNLYEQHGFEPDEFYANMAGEIVSFVTEPADGSQPDQIVLLKAHDIKQAQNALNRLAVNLADQNALQEAGSYGGLRVVQIALSEFPAQLFGDMFTGYPSTYFIFLNNYIILANSDKAMKNMLDEIEAGQVWAKSGQAAYWQQYIEPQANIIALYNTRQMWPTWMKALLPAKAKVAEFQKRYWLRFGMLVLQMRSSGSKADLLVSATFPMRQYQAGVQSANELQAVRSTRLPDAIVSVPWLVRNHVDNTWETLVQDEKNMLHLISAEGKKLWALSVGERIVSDVLQVDMYQNKKLQYLFCTSSRIYVVDRLGRLVSNFPLRFNWQAPLDFLSTVDYDKSGQYRIVVSDTEGNIYIFSKEGQVLPEWKPRRMMSRLSMPVRHIRTGARDCLLAIQTDGGINALKRNGEMLAGFPLKFSERIEGEAYLQEGSDLASTNILAINSQGEVIKVNLKGEVTGREQFAYDLAGGHFSLCIDQSARRDWVVARQLNKDNKTFLSIYRKNGQKAFDAVYENARSSLLVQYFYFGVDAEIIAVTDQFNSNTMLYYMNGQPLRPQGLENSFPVSMVYQASSGEVVIYKVHRNEVNRLAIRPE